MKCANFPPLAANRSVSMCGPGSESVRKFYQHTCEQPVVSDKVVTHVYHGLYGVHLMPLAARATTTQQRVKLLEIGLGCDMYEVGASATIWRTLMPTADIWLAEYDADCVAAMKRKGKLDGLNMLTGDQGEPSVLRSWLKLSGGGFDAIIDDGGHSNSMILTSFAELWPAVKPGGFYFMEDLQAGRNAGWPNTKPRDRAVVVSDVLQSWVEELLIGSPRGAWAQGSHSSSHGAGAAVRMPRDVEFISCQREMCVIAKTARVVPPPIKAPF